MKNNDKTQVLLSNSELLQASIEEFSGKSFESASTNEIIKCSGINKGSFYYRFNNKEELFVALADHIIVIQIDLYNQRGRNLNTLNSLRDVLFELYLNLYLLKKYNESFYNFIVRHLYDTDSSKLITSFCIEPLILRFKRKIATYNYLSNYNYISMLIDNLYQIFPKSLLLSKNIDEDLLSFIDFILVKHETSQRIASLNLENFFPTTNLSYILTNNQQITLDEKYHQLFTYFSNYNEVKKHLKKMSGLFTLNYNKLITRLIKRSFKDISNLKNLYNSEIEFQVKTDSDFQAIVFVLIYLTVKEVEFIVIDQTINLLQSKHKQLIFQEILPILSKTSKIIVLNETIDLYQTNDIIYLLDDLNQIHILTLEKLRNNYQNNYELAIYQNNDLVFKILSQEELTNILSNTDIINNIAQLRLIKSIDYQTVIRNEAF